MSLCLASCKPIRQSVRVLCRCTTANRRFAAKPVSMSIHKSSLSSFQKQSYLTLANVNESQQQQLQQADTKVDSSTDILLNSITSHQPKNKVISEEALQKLEELLRKSYNLPQLKAFLRHHGVKPSLRKAEVIRQITLEHWKLTTPERKRARELSERKNTSQQQLTLEKDEMFFVLGDNGNLLRDIEQQHKVRIMVNVSGLICTVEGTKKRLPAAVETIRQALTLERQAVRLTNDSATAASILATVPQAVIDDLSKTSGAYISFESNQIALAAPSKETIESAKRKLAVFMTDFGLTSKRSLQLPDYTVIQHSPSTSSSTPLCFSPLHDKNAMPMAMKTIGWSRVSRNDLSPSSSTDPEFQVLNHENRNRIGTENLSSLQVKEILQAPFQDKDDRKPISIEATFGHLLFQNPALVTGQTNLLIPALKGSFGIANLQALFQEDQHHRRFFSANPPSDIRMMLIPLPTREGDIHRRVVKLGYIDSSLLGKLRLNDSTPIGTIPASSLQRLQLEFIEKEDGTLEFTRATGEHARSTIDIIGLSGNVDVQLTAKEYTEFDNLQTKKEEDAMSASLLDLVYRCRLTGYSELLCPGVWKSDGNDMTLLDITFNNQSRFQLGDNLVTLQHVDEQESRTRRVEMKLTPFENGFDQWSSFWAKLMDLAQKWKYH